MQMGLLCVAHYHLILFVLRLIEDVLVEAESSQVEWVVPLDRLEYASQRRKLVEGHIKFTK